MSALDDFLSAETSHAPKQNAQPSAQSPLDAFLNEPKKGNLQKIAEGTYAAGSGYAQGASGGMLHKLFPTLNSLLNPSMAGRDEGENTPTPPTLNSYTNQIQAENPTLSGAGKIAGIFTPAGVEGIVAEGGANAVSGALSKAGSVAENFGLNKIPYLSKLGRGAVSVAKVPLEIGAGAGGVKAQQNVAEGNSILEGVPQAMESAATNPLALGVGYGLSGGGYVAGLMKDKVRLPERLYKMGGFVDQSAGSDAAIESARTLMNADVYPNTSGQAYRQLKDVANNAEKIRQDIFSKSLENPAAESYSYPRKLITDPLKSAGEKIESVNTGAAASGPYNDLRSSLKQDLSKQISPQEMREVFPQLKANIRTNSHDIGPTVTVNPHAAQGIKANNMALGGLSSAERNMVETLNAPISEGYNGEFNANSGTGKPVDDFFNQGTRGKMSPEEIAAVNEAAAKRIKDFNSATTLESAAIPASKEAFDLDTGTGNHAYLGHGGIANFFMRPLKQTIVPALSSNAAKYSDMLLNGITQNQMSGPAYATILDQLMNDRKQKLLDQGGQ